MGEEGGHRRGRWAAAPRRPSVPIPPEVSPPRRLEPPGNPVGGGSCASWRPPAGQQSLTIHVCVGAGWRDRCRLVGLAQTGAGPNTPLSERRGSGSRRPVRSQPAGRHFALRGGSLPAWVFSPPLLSGFPPRRRRACHWLRRRPALRRALGERVRRSGPSRPRRAGSETRSWASRSWWGGALALRRGGWRGARILVNSESADAAPARHGRVTSPPSTARSTGSG